MKRAFVMLIIFSSLLYGSFVFAQTKEESAPVTSVSSDQLGTAVTQAAIVQQQAISSAQFSPRWLITYGEDLYGRGMKELSLKTFEAAKMMTEVFRDEMANTKVETGSMTKEKVTKYTQSMLKLIEDFIKYIKTGDVALEAVIDQDRQEVMANDLSM